MACGVCRNCKNGLMPSACLNMREGGFRPDSPGGMGEYLVIEEEYVHRIPDDWKHEEGAWAGDFLIGYFGIWGTGYVDASDNVIIFGAFCRSVSGNGGKNFRSQSHCCRSTGKQTETALNYGADVVVDPTACDLREEIMRLTDGEGGSVVVEASGNDNAIASIFEVAGHSARVRLIGHL